MQIGILNLLKYKGFNKILFVLILRFVFFILFAFELDLENIFGSQSDDNEKNFHH